MTARLRRGLAPALLAVTVVLSTTADGVLSAQRRVRQSRTALMQTAAAVSGVAAVWDGLGRAWGLAAVCGALLVLEALSGPARPNVG